MSKPTVAKAPPALKRIECRADMPELKLRPPKNLLAVFSITIAIAAAGFVPLHAGQQQSGRVLRATTDLVTVLASVTDASNRPVPDLTEDAFQISEEGAPQKIEH